MTIKSKAMQPSLPFQVIIYGLNVALLTWVNDFLIVGSITTIKAEILTLFNRKDIGTSMHYIGLQILWYC